MEETEAGAEKGWLSKLFTGLSEGNMRQLIAGATLTVGTYAVAYAATHFDAGAVSGLVRDLMFTASWKTAPFHVLLVALTGFGGAAVMGAVDGRKKDSGPTPNP